MSSKIPIVCADEESFFYNPSAKSKNKPNKFLRYLAADQNNGIYKKKSSLQQIKNVIECFAFLRKRNLKIKKKSQNNLFLRFELITEAFDHRMPTFMNINNNKKLQQGVWKLPERSTMLLVFKEKEEARIDLQDYSKQVVKIIQCHKKLIYMKHFNQPVSMAKHFSIQRDRTPMFFKLAIKA